VQNSAAFKDADVGTGGNLLPDGDVDPHYTLILSADSAHSGPNTYTLTNPAGYPAI